MIERKGRFHLYTKKRQITVISMLALLAMVYCNLLGKHLMLIRIMSVAAVPFMLLCDDQRIRFDKLLLSLFLAQLLYVVFGHFVSPDNILMLIWTPVIGYMIGGLLARSARSHADAFRLALYTIAIASTLYETINYVVYGFRGARSIPDLWAGENWLLQATEFNSRGVYVVLIFYYVLKYEKWHLKAVFGVLTLASVCVSILTMARTNVYMLIVMTAMGMIYTFIASKGWRKRSISRNRLLLFSIMVPVACLLMALFAGRIIDAYTSTLTARIGTDLTDPMEMSRWRFSLNMINVLMKHPWGKPDEYAAHNLILDVGRDSGVIAMFFMLVFMIKTAIVVVRLVSLDRHNIQKNTLYLLTYFGLFLSFMLESVLFGRPLNYVAFCLLMGIMNDELTNRKRVEGTGLNELN